MPEFYQVQVPSGVQPGQAFNAEVGGVAMLVTCPEGILPGQTVQVAGPAASLPTVSGVPVGPSVSTTGEPVVTGEPILSAAGMYPSMGLSPAYDEQAHRPEVAYVEVDEISPSGWLCLIIGCFACPGLNLLGLCMRERRLIPLSHMQGHRWH